jgi:uncharacterized protein (DUF736 family)
MRRGRLMRALSKDGAMIIGKFTYDNGSFTGDIIAGFMALPGVAIKPVTSAGEGRPDYRVTTCCGELGAAWKKTSAKANEYLSVKLDSPFLPAPVNCALIKQLDGSHALIWSRAEKEGRQL